MLWHLRLGGHCHSASRVNPRKLYRAVLLLWDVPCEGGSVFLSQGSLRNLIRMVMGLLGGPLYSSWTGLRSITNQLLLLLWKTKVILREDSGPHCWYCCLFSTEYNSCGFPRPPPAVHRASAARGLEVESAWGPHPWYRWDSFIVAPLQCWGHEWGIWSVCVCF